MWTVITLIFFIGTFWTNWVVVNGRGEGVAQTPWHPPTGNTSID